MSILGAMRSGVSGLASQSYAFSAISDNISNISTVGYKGTSTAFKTLVTKQTSSSTYASGGVQSVSTQAISAQGLLSGTSSSTDLAISGNGYFVVNQAANPGNGDTWAYTRAGSFSTNTNGFLKNSGGYYAQAWSLLPWDGSPQASVVNIQGINYMKAYYNESGQVVYINDNIIDSTNLKPINLATIGGTATATTQLSMGANLPASDMIGGSQKLSALIYDSLGNASNLSIDFNKQGSNRWGMNVSIPSGAANLTLIDSAHDNSIYYAAGQLEFTSIPTNGSTITITDEMLDKTFTFEFVENPALVTGDNIAVSTNVSSVADFINNLTAAMKANLSSGDRFVANNNTVKITQSTVGGALNIDASQTLACVQNAANLSDVTGLPTGQFSVSALTPAYTNGAAIVFTGAVTDYIGKSFKIGGKNFSFTDTDPVPGTKQDGEANPFIINIAGATNIEEVINLLHSSIVSNIADSECYTASGNTLEITPTTTSNDIAIDVAGLNVKINAREKGELWSKTLTNFTLTNTFVSGDGSTQQGAQVAAILFHSNGTPQAFGVDGLNIEWANGAKKMSYETGNHIKIKMGNAGTSDGFTQLSGDFSTSYIKQDGAKFGNYAGVYIDESGVVTAVFDNGETRPIAILPLATFSNPDGMSSLTGNVWIASDDSGDPMLRQAGTNGAGDITSYSLEDSTVDLANELSNMVVVQRAYSASTKIITTADKMLDELTRMV